VSEEKEGDKEEAEVKQVVEDQGETKGEEKKSKEKEQVGGKQEAEEKEGDSSRESKAGNEEGKKTNEEVQVIKATKKKKRAPNRNLNAAEKKAAKAIANKVAIQKRVVDGYESLKRRDVSPQDFRKIYNENKFFTGQDLNWTGIAWQTLTVKQAQNKCNLLRNFFRIPELGVNWQRIQKIVNEAATFHADAFIRKSADQMSHSVIDFESFDITAWKSVPEFCIRGIACPQVADHQPEPSPRNPILIGVSAYSPTKKKSRMQRVNSSEEEEESDEGISSIFPMPPLIGIPLTDDMSGRTEFAGSQDRGCGAADWKRQEEWLICKYQHLKELIWSQKEIQRSWDHSGPQAAESLVLRRRYIVECHEILAQIAAGRSRNLVWVPWGTAEAEAEFYAKQQTKKSKKKRSKKNK
jgi:hypothetical protein